MEKYKYWVVIILLLSGAVLSFAFTKEKYVGTGFIAKLDLPVVVAKWRGENITEEVNGSIQRSTANFISDMLSYQYTNNEGKKLLFIILDAGNFHHPKGCFTSAGFNIRELDDTEFNVMGRRLQTHTLFTEKGEEKFLSFYWIIIDKNIVHEWIDQKIKQLYFSLFNKKRVGLMVRIDVLTDKDKMKDSMIIAKDFINDMSKTLHQEELDYIFGQR
ncbi:MAG: EpsI family protein [Nitrospirae bacterium]|nr:EpsI family protein [Nitrospirota bacterium]